MKSIATFYLVVTVLLVGCQSSEESADLILTNGNLLLMDTEFSTAEAIAVKGDRILMVGSNEEIAVFGGPDTQVIDLEGKTATPGIIESHIHFAQLGRRIHQLFLNNTRSSGEAVDLVRAKASDATPGEWIIGAGWHTATWGSSGYPDGNALSAATPDNPVLLTGMSWHAVWVNDIVMKMAGITKDTQDPVGGTIVRNPETGKPTGVFLETATKLVEAMLPKESEDDLQAVIRSSNDAALAMGITTVHDAQANTREIAAYRKMIPTGDLKVRVYIMYHVSEFDDEFDALLETPPEIGSNNNHLTLRTLKIFSDGALGARGAALLQPYSDDPSTSGLLRDEEDVIEKVVRQAYAAGYQVAYHAIGDRANRLVLDAFEKAQTQFPQADLRPRIEHAQILSLDDLPRFGELDVIASMQPLHFSLDAAFAETRLGRHRLDGAYAWKSLINSGATIIANADTPFSPVRHSHPLIGIYAAVSRRALDGSAFDESLEQAVTRREAIEMYTVNPAYAGFEEELKGSLTAGKLADITVWSKDIATVPAEELLKTEAIITIVGGEIVFDRNDL